VERNLSLATVDCLIVAFYCLVKLSTAFVFSEKAEAAEQIWPSVNKRLADPHQSLAAKFAPRRPTSGRSSDITRKKIQQRNQLVIVHQLLNEDSSHHTSVPFHFWPFFISSASTDVTAAQRRRCHLKKCKKFSLSGR
jgi:hypothetical protein